MDVEAARAELVTEILRSLRGDAGEFETLILRVAAWQREANPAYAAYCRGRPEPRRWQEIPALPLSAFREADIFCGAPGASVRTFRTSGTTGEGYGRHDFRTLDFYREAAQQGWKRAGLPDLPIYGLLPSPAEAPFSSLSCMAGWLIEPERFFWNRWDALAAELQSRTEPCLLFGTALAFLDFFEKGESLSLPPGSAALETGGYKGTGRSLPKEDLYRLFEQRLALDPGNVWNEYGMTELSSQFYTRGLDRPHQGGPWVRGLVVDPRTGAEARDGETGVLHVFDLANLDSCCALQTRDLAARRGGDFLLIGRDPNALPRGCSRAADSLLAP